MLSHITWQQYWLTIGLVTFSYYLFSWIYFYRAAIPVLYYPGKYESSSHPKEDIDEILQAIKHIEEELKPLFIGRSNKNELLFALRNRLRRYSKWNHPGFRDQLNEFISTQSHNICSIQLEEDDLRAVWQ